MSLVSNVSPVLFSIGPVTIRWYGLLFAMGFVIATQMVRTIFTKVGQDVDRIDTLSGYIIAGTIIGARLGHTLIYEPEIFLADPIRILKVWEGGLASHGGTVGALLAAYLWNRKYSRGNYLLLLDLLALPTTVVTVMIRLGNFFNSEILGKQTDFFLGVVFERIDAVPRHPAMLYEAFAYFINYLILRQLFKKDSYLRQGLLFGSFLILCFSERFLIEFVKEPQVKAEVGMSWDYGQLLSIPFVALGIYLVVRAMKSQKLKTVITRKTKKNRPG